MVLDEIARLNSMAIECMLDSSRQQDAVPCIEKAMLLLRTEAAKTGEEVSGRSDGSNISVLALGEINMSQSHPERDCVFTYNSRVFGFVCTGNGCLTCSSKSDESVVLCIMLFNWALLHHHVGLVSGESLELSRAMNLYQLALSAMSDLEGGTLNCDDDVELLLLCSLYNNIGHIFSFFHQAEEAKSCLEGVQTIMLQTTAPFCSEEYKEEFSFFFQYLSANPEDMFCFAPAA